MKRLQQSGFDVRKTWLGGMAGLLAGVAMLVVSTSAMAAAAISPFSIVGIDEWDLPVVQEPINLMMQTGVFWNIHDEYNANGDKVSLGGTINVFEGVTRFAHLWMLSDKVGTFWEILVPEIWFRLPTALGGNTISGIGDPILDYTLYYKPNKHWMIGGQVFQQIPIGTTDSNPGAAHFTAGSLSNFTGTRAWVTVPNMIVYYQNNGWGIQGTVAVGIPWAAGHNSDPGKFYSAQASARYKVLPWLELGVTDVYQYTESGTYFGTDRGNARQNEVGPAFKINFRPGTFLSGQYYIGTGGKNALRANELSLRFVQVW